MKFYQYLKTKRLEMGYSVAQLADLTAISASVIYQYEDNKAFPSGKNLIRLARVLGFSLDEIFVLPARPFTAIPCYDRYGNPIYDRRLQPDQHSALYQYDVNHLILVHCGQPYQAGHYVLGFIEKQCLIFQILFLDNHFFLLQSDGSLHHYHDPKIHIIGEIRQWITLAA